MAFKKVLLLSLLVTVASVISLSDASDRERPPRTLSWFSSSSSASQVKTEQPSSPQVQTPLPTVVPTVSTQSLRLPYVYSVRYYSDLSPQDRSNDQVLVGQLEGGAQDARGAPCPYDQVTRVAGIGASPAPPNERIAGYSYQYQTPTVVVPSSPTVTLTQQSQLPTLQVGPAPQQTGQSVGSSPVAPMVHLPHHHHHEHEHDHHEHPPMVLPVPVMAPPQLQQSQSSQIQQIPGSLLPFLQAAAAVATSSPHSHQHQGVVLPIYTVPQVAHSALMTTPPQHQQQPRPQLHEYQPHQILHQQLHQHQQHQQHQQYQQKVVPSVVGDYPYYYLYPEFVYVVPVLQPPQTSASSPTTQQLQQGVPFQLTQRHQQQQHQQVQQQQQPHHQQQQHQQQQQQTQHQTTMSVSGQHTTSDEVRQHQQQHHPQQQQQQQQQSRQQTNQKQ